MRQRVPVLGERFVPPMVQGAGPSASSNLPPELADQLQQGAAPQGTPSAEEMFNMASAKYNEGKNPAFQTGADPVAASEASARSFIGDTEMTRPAATVNDVPQLDQASTNSDVAQAANNQAAGFGFTEPIRDDTAEGGLGYAAVDPSRFATSQQEQNQQILGAEDLAMTSASQRATTLSKIQARNEANYQFNKKNNFDAADTTSTLESRIGGLKDVLSKPNPEFTFGYDPVTGQVISPIEEVMRQATLQDKDVGGFLYDNPADVGAMGVKKQQLLQEVIPAVLALAGPHAMHSLQLEAKSNAEGSSAASTAANTNHHGVDANQFQHLLQSNIKDYFRNANLGKVSDETSARLAQIATDFYEMNGEIAVVANPDPVDALKRPYLLESTVTGKRAIDQMKAAGGGLFGGVREGFYTAPALNLIGRLGEFTRTSLGILQKKYLEIMGGKAKGGASGISGHEVTKIIKGSVAEGTSGVGVASNAALYGLVIQGAQFDNSDLNAGPKLMWSTHPAAAVFGLSEDDFKVYKGQFKQPKDNAGNFTLDQATFERKATAHALNQMTDRLAEFASTVPAEVRGDVNIGSNPDTAAVLMAAMAQNKPLYSRFINSLLNNRFYRTNILYNPEASKFHRNISNFHEQPTVSKNTFEYKPAGQGGGLLALQEKVKGYEGKLGADFSEDLHKNFTIPEQSALGMMAILAKLYIDLNGTAGPNGKSGNLTPLQLIGTYNKDVHNWAIEQGEIINRFINGDASVADQVGELFKDSKGKPWKGIEEGELGSNFNPLIDAYLIANAEHGKPHRITTTVAMDVTQSGPAITGLLTAFLNEKSGGKTLQALYTPGWTNADGTITGEKDLRGMMAQNLPQFIKDAVPNEDKLAQLMTIVKAMDDKGVLEKFFKLPIMTTIYTRDSGSFASDIDNFFVEQGLSGTVDIEANVYPGGRAQLRKDWASVMKVGLDNTLSTQLTKFMSGLGSYTAMAGVALVWDLPTGAPLLIASTGLRPQRSNKVLDLFEGSNSTEADKVMTHLFSKDGPVTLETSLYEEAIDPTAAKDTQWFLNTEQTAWLKFTNPAGSKQARQAGVSWVHALDAALVELTYMALNTKAMTSGVSLKGIAGDQKLPPIPAYTVHDAIVTTPAGLLHYHNAYNNVAIPQLINWMRDSFTKQVDNKLPETRNNFKATVNAKGSTTIGMFGDNANISSQLDNLWFKFYPEGSPAANDYKQYYIENNNKNNPAEAQKKYEKYKADSTATLQQAVKLGYRTPGSGKAEKFSSFPTDTTFTEQSKTALLTDVAERAHRDSYTIPAKDAIALFDLVAKDILRLNVFDTTVGNKHQEFLTKLRHGPKAALDFFRTNAQIQKFGLNSLKM